MTETVFAKDLQNALKTKLSIDDTDMVSITKHQDEVIIKKIQKEIPPKWQKIFSEGDEERKKFVITKKQINDAVKKVR